MTQAVANGFLAPGTWDSSYTFGNQADFLNNIATVWILYLCLTGSASTSESEGG